MRGFNNLMTDSHSSSNLSLTDNKLPDPSKDLRSDFSIFKTGVAYLDSAATSQKPDQVIRRIESFYETQNANIHRGVYELSESATRSYELVRKKVADYLGIEGSHQIIFTRGTTESINLVAQSWGADNLKEGDEIVLTTMEHHSNIVPWQLIAKKTGAVIKSIPLDETHRLDLDKAASVIGEKTKLLAVTHVSNVLGYINPVKKLVSMAKAVGAVTVVDGAQAVPHFSIDIKDLGCDFYAFSGHKMLGPTGVGVLYGSEDLLNKMTPYQGGGDMIEKVTIEESSWAPLPNKFEAGTPNIAGVIGLGAAIDYLARLDRSKLLEKDIELGNKALAFLKGQSQVRTFADPGEDWVGIVTFYHEAVHPHDMAALADADKVCIRAGHHCAQPLMQHFGVPATSRVSPYIYNNDEDIDRFGRVVEKATALFS